MTTHFGRLMTIGAATAIAVGLIAASPAFAAVSSTVATVNSPVNSYTTPAFGGPAVKAFKPGDTAQVHCSEEGAYANGSNIWLRLAKADGGGFVPRYAVNVGSVDRC